MSVPLKNYRSNLILFLCLVATLATAALHLTKNTSHVTWIVHEWVGRALLVMLLIHLVQHRKWLMGMGGKVFGPVPWKIRLQMALVVPLVVSAVIVVASGIHLGGTPTAIDSATENEFVGLDVARRGHSIREHALASSGEDLAGSSPHAHAGIVFGICTVAHLALNWGWIRTAARRRAASP